MCRLPVREEQTASIDEALKAAEWLTEEELQQEQQKIFASWASRAYKRVPGMTNMVSSQVIPCMCSYCFQVCTSSGEDRAVEAPTVFRSSTSRHRVNKTACIGGRGLNLADCQS